MPERDVVLDEQLAWYLHVNGDDVDGMLAATPSAARLALLASRERAYLRALAPTDDDDHEALCAEFDQVDAELAEDPHPVVAASLRAELHALGERLRGQRERLESSNEDHRERMREILRDNGLDERKLEHYRKHGLPQRPPVRRTRGAVRPMRRRGAGRPPGRPRAQSSRSSARSGDSPDDSDPPGLTPAARPPARWCHGCTRCPLCGRVLILADGRLACGQRTCPAWGRPA